MVVIVSGRWRIRFERQRQPFQVALLIREAPIRTVDHARRLTVKLSGRPQARPARRERRIAKRARGAQPPTRHGPLQGLLDRTSTTPIEQVE